MARVVLKVTALEYTVLFTCRTLEIVMRSSLKSSESSLVSPVHQVVLTVMSSATTSFTVMTQVSVSMLPAYTCIPVLPLWMTVTEGLGTENRVTCKMNAMLCLVNISYTMVVLHLLFIVTLRDPLEDISLFRNSELMLTLQV